MESTAHANLLCPYPTCCRTGLRRGCFFQVRDNGKCRVAKSYMLYADDGRIDQQASSVKRVLALQFYLPLQYRASTEPSTLTQHYLHFVSLVMPQLCKPAFQAGGNEEQYLV